RSAKAQGPGREAEAPRPAERGGSGAEPHGVDSGATPGSRHRLAGEAREDHEGDAVERAVARCESEEERQTRDASHARERGGQADENRNEHRTSAIAIGHSSTEESADHRSHL